jgi:HEAT repeat protein
MLDLLRDEAPEVRRVAVESLGKIGDPRAVDSILSLKVDPVESVRQAAVVGSKRLIGLEYSAILMRGLRLNRRLRRIRTVGYAAGRNGDLKLIRVHDLTHRQVPPARCGPFRRFR